MRSREKWVAISLVLILGGLVARCRITYSLQSQPSMLELKPFVAEGYVRYFAEKGEEGPSIVELTTSARKGDGSWVEAITYHDVPGEVGSLRTIWDVTSGRDVTLESTTRSTTTYFLTPSEMRSAMRSEIRGFISCPPGANSPTAEHKRILGYDVVKVTEESPGPHQTRHLDETWVAPDLACFALRRSETNSDGPHTEFETTRITEGVPPAWMFEVPDYYVERSPRQQSAAWAAKFGHESWPDSILARLDKRYYAHRVPQAPSRP